MKRSLIAGCAALVGFGLFPAAPVASAAGAGPLVRVASLGVRSAPAGAQDLGAAPGAAPVMVEVVLAPSDPSAVGAFVAGLYDQSSPTFHQWVTPAQYAARFGPSATTVSEAISWLRSRGLSPSRPSTFALKVEGPVAAMDRAFGVTFHRYRERAGASGWLAIGAPLAPSALAVRIESIAGLSTLPEFQSMFRAVRPSAVRRPSPPRPESSTVHASGVRACSAAHDAAAANGGYTMDQLTGFYGINRMRAYGLNGAGQTVGVFELSQYSSSDVAAYERCFGLSNPVSVQGSADPTADVSEADLDIEQVATQAPDAAIVSYEGQNSEVGAYDVWASIVRANKAKVISTSWAECEPDAAAGGETSSGGIAGLLQEAAAQGQTILAASGDSGSEGCAQDYPSSGYNRLAVDFPASDPYVTGTGGTDYYGAGVETPWNDCYPQAGQPADPSCASTLQYQAAGGGGQSAYEKRQSWQPVASGARCSTCREVPDLSANAGIPMVIYDSGQGGWAPGVGSSFAAPFLAGLVADRNQGCSARTGNFAPTLYALAKSAGWRYAFSRPTATGNGAAPFAAANNDMLTTNHGQYPVLDGYNMATGIGVPIAAGLSCAEVESLSPTIGWPGTPVTITGLGLENARILFGSKQVTPSHVTATSATVVAPAGLSGTVTVHADYSGNAGRATAKFTYSIAQPGCPSNSGSGLNGAVGIAAVTIKGCDGYFVADSAGRVAAFGSAVSHGDLGSHALNSPIIAIVATPDGGGYWLLGSDGGVFTFGDARFFGSTGAIRLRAPVVGMAPTSDNRGYWIVAKDGGVFTFGDGRFYGSTGNLTLVAPVDGIAVAPGGHGYWLVASDGGVFTFTTDGFYGSLGGKTLAKPIIGMSGTPDGRGYTLVGVDGGVFSFGDAPFYGSLGANPPPSPVVDLSPAPGNNGYYLVTAAGAVYPFGPGTHYLGNA